MSTTQIVQTMNSLERQFVEGLCCGGLFVGALWLLHAYEFNGLLGLLLD